MTDQSNSCTNVQFGDSKQLRRRKAHPKLGDTDSQKTCNPGTLCSLQAAEESNISFSYLAGQNLHPQQLFTLFYTVE